MEKETVYKLNDEDLESVIGLVTVRIMLGMLSKDMESIKPDTLKIAVKAMLDEKK